MRHENGKMKNGKIPMTNAIISFASNAYASLPTLRLSSPSEMIKKATAIAIPAILLLGAQSAQVADGGLISAWVAAAACVGIGFLSIPASGGLSTPMLLSCEAAFAAGLILPLP